VRSLASVQSFVVFCVDWIALIEFQIFVSVHLSVTGSCFFVFSGALKPSSGYLAKSSIVEG